MICFCFCFFKDMNHNTMIRTFCILKKNDVQCFSLPDFVDPLWGIRYTCWLTVFNSEKHILWIHFGENFIDIWGWTDFGPYSSQSLFARDFEAGIKGRVLGDFSGLFRDECKSNIILLTMYVYYVYPAMSKSLKQQTNFTTKSRNRNRSNRFQRCF